MTALVRTYVERSVSGSWSDISSYTVGDVEVEYLIPSNRETDKIASVGRAKLLMNNEDGLFSPSSVFQRGTPIRVRTLYDGTYKTRFLGTILELDPDTLEWGNQYVRVTAVDWMNFAVEQPMIVTQMMTGTTGNEAVARLLSQMAIQPESVTYYDSRERFDFVFDAVKKETKTYSELNKLAMSEFAPIYLRAGNVLVVESADTRHGQRELTQVPRAPIQLDALLADPNGYSIICADVTGTSAKYAILIDEMITPNFASGTNTFTDIELKNGDMLNNRVIVRAYPARYDETNVLLYQMDVGAINLPTFGTVTIRGSWANPDGGGPINALTTSFSPMITGTNYTAFSEVGNDISTQLQITERYGTESFEHTVYNNGVGGFITRFNIYGKGIYPYNPTETVASHTGSVNSYGIAQLTIEQKYQDTLDAGMYIIESILDRDKEPRNDVKNITFEASSHPDLMQASQYIDIGDLVWVKNVKPAVDTYCYVQGKKTIIAPQGWITEKWYLKETDTLRKGLTPVAIEFSGGAGAENNIDFGYLPYLDNLTDKTITARVKIRVMDNYPIVSKYDTFAGWYFVVRGSSGRLRFRQNFTGGDGVWDTTNVAITTTGSYHLAVTYDATNASNNPSIYVNGSSVAVSYATGTPDAIPVGTVSDDGNIKLLLGNRPLVGGGFDDNLNGWLTDVRIYDRILTVDEIGKLAASQENYLLVPDDLLFQAPAVRTEDYGNLTGTVLYPPNKVIDNMYGIRGTPSWFMSSGTSYGVRIGDYRI